MSVSHRHCESALRVALLWGLVGCGGIILADDAEAPDLEFLEYLGSWEESEEDWILFAEQIESQDELQENDGSDPAPDGEKLAELEDES